VDIISTIYSFRWLIIQGINCSYIHRVCISGCGLSWSIREARQLRNDLTGKEMEEGGGGRCSGNVMRPRGALCGVCENTLLWDVETVLYGRWKLGRSRLSSYCEGMSSGGVWWNQ